MSTIKPKSAFMSVRMTDKTRQRFHVKASKFGQPTTVLRELIEAFIEDRLTIQAPVTRKEKLYVP
jgi:predicted DNA-binding protein